MPLISGMLATTGTQARAVTPATRNSKGDSNSMTVRNRSASNRRNERFNRTAKIGGIPAKVGTLTKGVKSATACREANYGMDTINIGDVSSSSSRENWNIVDVDSSRTARQKKSNRLFVQKDFILDIRSKMLLV